MSTYKTFIRSARNFQEFSSAPKRTVETGLTEQDAREACKAFNDHRTPAQIERGTKMEFTSE